MSLFIFKTYAGHPYLCYEAITYPKNILSLDYHTGPKLLPELFENEYLYPVHGYWLWKSDGEYKTSRNKRGWKIHISARKKSGLKIAQLTLPFIRSQNIDHKIAVFIDDQGHIFPREYATDDHLLSQQRGKFITVYTSNEEKTLEIGTKLDQIFMSKGLRFHDFSPVRDEYIIGESGGVSMRFSKGTGLYEGVPPKTKSLKESSLIFEDYLEVKKIHLNNLRVDLQASKSAGNSLEDIDRSISWLSKIQQISGP